MAADSGLSRRDFFKRFLGGGVASPSDVGHPQHLDEVPKDAVGQDLVAVIQAKYCLAYEEIPCTDCHDHCPEPNVIVMEQGVPRIQVERCTGCRICQDVCPSSAEAILMVKRFQGSSGVW